MTRQKAESKKKSSPASWGRKQGLGSSPTRGVWTVRRSASPGVRLRIYKHSTDGWSMSQVPHLEILMRKLEDSREIEVITIALEGG